MTVLFSRCLLIILLSSVFFLSSVSFAAPQFDAEDFTYVQVGVGFEFKQMTVFVKHHQVVSDDVKADHGLRYYPFTKGVSLSDRFLFEQNVQVGALGYSRKWVIPSFLRQNIFVNTLFVETLSIH